MILADGEADGREVLEFAVRQIGIARDEGANRLEVSGKGGADHGPDVDAAAAGPLLIVGAAERFGLDHARELGGGVHGL
jgi:hypothetical protein